MSKGRFGGGDGSSENPFLIEDADDLNAIRQHLSSNFKLVNDINLADGVYNVNQGWNPISDFTGYLDGNNKKIINLYINRPTMNNVGLFSNIAHIHANNDLRVANIYLIDCEVRGYNNVGGFIGNGNNYINNVYVTGKIYGNKNIGGIIGYQDAYSYTVRGGWSSTNRCYDYYTAYSNITVYNCVFRGIIHNEQKIACGICGDGSINFDSCSSILYQTSGIVAYYPMCVGGSCTNCYTDNTQVNTVDYGGVTKTNLLQLEPSNNPLSVLSTNLFRIQSGKSLEPKSANKSSIYVKFDNVYHIYDCSTKEWVVVYTDFNEYNSNKIIQDGMTEQSFKEIPSDVWRTLSQKYSKIEIVNCIINHDKIESESHMVNLVEVKSTDKKVTSKILFSNDKWDPIISLKKQ